MSLIMVALAPVAVDIRVASSWAARQTERETDRLTEGDRAVGSSMEGRIHIYSLPRVLAL